MKELLTQLLKSLPKQTLVTLVILLGFVWANDRVKKNAEMQNITINSINEVKTEMRDGFESVDKRFNVVETNILDVKTNLSEQEQVTGIVVNQLPAAVRDMVHQTKEATRQTQEIYNQMKRDQSPQDRKISEDESYIMPIEPLESELQVYTEPIKKKLNQQTRN